MDYTMGYICYIVVHNDAVFVVPIYVYLANAHQNLQILLSLKILILLLV